MVYKCKNCGAKLNIKKTDEIITCEYCGSVNKINFSSNNGSYSFSVNTKKYLKFYIIFAAVMIIFGFLSFLFSGPKNNKILKNDENYYFGTFKYNYYQDYGYLINNNNDEFLDIATVGLNIENSKNYLQILDGKTGKRIKSVEIDKEKEPKLFVIDNKYIFIARNDFTLSIYDKTNLSEIKTFALSDKFDHYEFADNTLYFDTYDDNKQTIDLTSLKLEKSNFKKELNKRAGNYSHRNYAVENNTIYTAKLKKRSSKKVFSVIAENEKKELWNLPLGFEDITWWNGPVLILAGQNIITFGKKFTSDNLGYLIGIDKTEGRIKYEVQKSGKDCRLFDLYFNGRYIIANIAGSFFAFDPSNGKTKWQVGDKCE